MDSYESRRRSPSVDIQPDSERTRPRTLSRSGNACLGDLDFGYATRGKGCACLNVSRIFDTCEGNAGCSGRAFSARRGRGSSRALASRRFAGCRAFETRFWPLPEECTAADCSRLFFQGMAEQAASPRGPRTASERGARFRAARRERRNRCSFFSFFVQWRRPSCVDRPAKIVGLYSLLYQHRIVGLAPTG